MPENLKGHWPRLGVWVTDECMGHGHPDQGNVALALAVAAACSFKIEQEPGSGGGWSAQASRAKSHLNGNKCCVQTIYKNQFYNVMRSELLQCHVPSGWDSEHGIRGPGLLVLRRMGVWKSPIKWNVFNSVSSGKWMSWARWCHTAAIDTIATAFRRRWNFLATQLWPPLQLEIPKKKKKRRVTEIDRWIQDDD